jgi:hypothetical protein
MLLVGFLFAQHAGCSCNGNGHIPMTPIKVVPGDNIVNCGCNISFDYHSCTDGICFASFEIELCLPPELRSTVDTDMGFLAPADGGVENYANRIDDYCRVEITNAAYHLVASFNGGWCGYKAGFAPDGGIGSSVQCFGHEIHPGMGDATRHQDGVCPDVCPAIKCDYNTNCGDGVQDAEGNVHIENCHCTQVTDAKCPGDPPGSLPTVTFCRPGVAPNPM